MATLLEGVNEALRRASVIDDDVQTLTDQRYRVFINTVVQTWNEAVDELYSLTRLPRPNELVEDTLTLAAGDRDYALASDLVQLHFPLHDAFNGRYISAFPGGYLGLRQSQPHPDNFTGLPIAAAIRPTDGELYLDRIPTSAEAGLTYTYFYDKDLSLEDEADTFPFTDAVFRALIPAVTELFKHNRQREFDAGLYRRSMGNASRLLTRMQPRDSWTPRAVQPAGILDPLTRA